MTRDFRDHLGDLTPNIDLGATPEQIIKRGRRIRHLRQGLVAGSAAVAVLGLAATTIVLDHHSSHVAQTASGGNVGLATTSSSSPSGLPAASAWTARASATAQNVATTCPPLPQSASDPSGAIGDNPAPWGTVITVGTGDKDLVGTGGYSVVLYGIPVADPALPCTNFGFMLGTKDTATGSITGVYELNESAGDDMGAGFHATGLADGIGSLPANTWYVVGYYVGAANSISIPADGAATQASVQPWSVNPDVKIWWISGTGTAPAFGAPTAKDAQGNPLPAGNAAPPALG